MNLDILNRIFPEYDFSEHHQLWISAKPEKVYQTFKRLDFGESWVLKILFFLRGIRSGELLQKMFVTLIDHSPDAFVQGLIGKPWTFTGKLVKFEPSQFFEFNPPNTAKMIWGFFFIAQDGGCLVITETRIKCSDVSSKKKFQRYWLLIRPLSGLVRILILRLLRKKIEALR